MSSTTRFSTSLRDHVRRKIEQLAYADIVVGIPSYYSGPSIVHVIQTLAEGLNWYYPEAKAIIMISDGGSTDDSREIANLVGVNSYNIEKIVTIYRGVPGKGSGLRAVFETANFLRAKAVAVFDSDLISIKPEWVKNVLNPIYNGYDYVAPDYLRYKFDATITNTIAYNLTRTLYGQRIRQPIGGEFGISQSLFKYYLDQDVWETDVAKFGIDIWMTTTAVVKKFKTCQARLGVKVHAKKDPTEDLGPMFRQVVGTTFQLMEQYEKDWKEIRGSKDIPVFGEYIGEEPAPFEIDQNNLIEYFRIGFNNFSGIWEKIIESKDFGVIKNLSSSGRNDRFLMPVESWVRIVYQYSAAFRATPRQRFKLLDTMIPLYYARVASLMNELKGKSAEESEMHFEEQAVTFENMKDYLLKIWK